MKNSAPSANTAFSSAGLSGDAGLIWFLTRLVGPSRARDMCLRPEKFDGCHTQTVGVVTRAVPREALATRPGCPRLIEDVDAQPPVHVAGLGLPS